MRVCAVIWWDVQISPELLWHHHLSSSRWSSPLTHAAERCTHVTRQTARITVWEKKKIHDVCKTDLEVKKNNDDVSPQDETSPLE